MLYRKTIPDTNYNHSQNILDIQRAGRDTIHNLEKNYSTDPEIRAIIGLSNKNFKIALINMLEKT